MQSTPRPCKRRVERGHDVRSIEHRGCARRERRRVRIGKARRPHDINCEMPIVHCARCRADVRRQARPHEHDAQAVETLLAGRQRKIRSRATPAGVRGAPRGAVTRTVE